MKLGYFNKGKDLMVATIESENVDKIIGVYVFDLLKNESEIDIRNKHISIDTDGKILVADGETHEIPDGKTSAHSFVNMLAEDEEGYIFDTYAVYNVKNGLFTELNENDFETMICGKCGAVYFKKDMIGNVCIDCYVKEIPETLKNFKTSEYYTEFETDSEVDEIINSLVSNARVYANGLLALNKADTCIKNFLEEKKVSMVTRKRLVKLYAC